MSYPWVSLRHIAAEIEGLVENSNILEKWEKDRLSDLAPHPALVVFVGPWNSGKSTLINGLLCSPGLLPTGPIPVTSLITEIRHHPTDLFQIVYEGHRQIFKTAEDFKHCLKKLQPSSPSEACFAEIGLERNPLGAATLVDTPGTNAPSTIHEVITDAYVPRADAVIYVVQGSFAGRADDIVRLRNILLRTRPCNVFIVFNHALELGVDERQQLLSFVLDRLDLDEPLAGVFFTEAILADHEPQPATLDQSDPSGLGEFRTALKKYLHYRGEAAVWDRIIRTIGELVFQQQRSWSEELNQLSKTEAQVERHLAKLRTQIKSVELDLERELEGAEVHLAMIGAEVKGEFLAQLERVRASADQMVGDMEDPSSDSERSAMLNAVRTLIDQCIQTTANRAVGRLDREIKGISKRIRMPELSPKAFSLPDADHFDVEEMIREKLDQLLDLIESLRPVVESLGDRRLREFADDLRGKITLVASLLTKFGPILRDLVEKVERDNYRSALRSSVASTMAEISEELFSGIDTWWKDVVRLTLESVREAYTGAFSDILKPLEDAQRRFQDGYDSIVAQRKCLETRLQRIEAKMSLIRELQDGTEKEA